MTTMTVVPPGMPDVEAPHAFPTTPAQQRFWVLDQLDPGSAAYTIPVAVRLCGTLDTVALRRALELVVERHEALRTVFALEGEEPMQLVYETITVPFDETDLRALPVAEREARVLAAATGAANAPFDLARGPLVRAALLRLAGDEHVLLLTLHHIVADGTSVGILFRDLGELYGALVRDAAAVLAPLPIQYPDFAVWQRRMLAGGAAARKLDYWRERLRALPVLDMPTDRPRGASVSSAGEQREIVLPPDVVASARALARRDETTPFVTFLTAFVALLHRYTGQSDLVVGSITAGRDRAETENLIGLFLNTVPIRADVEGDPTFAELLARVRDSALGAISNADVPFEQIVDAAAVERDPARTPVFQAAFQLLEHVGGALRLGDVAVEPVARPKHTAKFELTLMLNAAPGGALRAVLEYNTDLYDRETADRLLGHYATLLASAVARPETHVSALDLMAASERAAVIAAGGRAGTPLPSWTTPARVLDRARERPDAIAVEVPGAPLTYRELARRSAIVAARLAVAGVVAGDRVAVCMDRTPALLVALLAIHRAGAAYVPVDPAYPAARITHVLEDVDARVILVDRTTSANVPAGAPPILVVDAGWWSDTVSDEEAFARPALDPESLAYVIYTSGSTGRPKGVMIPHCALANFVDSMARRPGLSADDAAVALTTISFDIAGLELWLPLVAGARIVLASRATTVDGGALRTLVEHAGASTRGRLLLQATPATWRLLLAAGWTGAPNVVMLCGGEAWPATLAARLLPCGSQLWNVYGPTETTIWSTAGRIVSADHVSLGEPIANTMLHVLEPTGALAAVGIPGELWIGGAGLARGYHRRPELTAERFVAHPELGRLYRTGDRVRRREDGTLDFLGRADDQVKLRGYRVELGEIERTLSAHADVREAVVAVSTRAGAIDGDAEISAYIVPVSGTRPGFEALRDHCRTTLPEYMVPTRWAVLTELPLTPNGKIDRRSLPTTLATFPDDTPTLPRTPVESLVAGIWADVLGRDAVPVDANFFALGGHSLRAMQIVARLRDLLGTGLTIGDFLRSATVEGVARQVSTDLAARGISEEELGALLRELFADSEGPVQRYNASRVPGEGVSA